MFFSQDISRKARNVRVIQVNFNAWEYSGCQILWAGIVTKLAAQLEEKFGKYKVRLCRHLFQYESSHTDPELDLSKSNSFTVLKCIKCKLHSFVSWLLCLLFVSLGSLIYFLVRKGISAVGTQIIGAFSSFFAVVSIISKCDFDDCFSLSKLCIFFVCFVFRFDKDSTNAGSQHEGHCKGVDKTEERKV